jgi:hypothetical protein
MSLPDIGFGMIPTVLPGTTGVGCSANALLPARRSIGSLLQYVT